MKKKGLSGVIVSIILIGLALVAVAIVWVVISNIL
ncbi:MAG: archaellin/type IV pilin N-terminal domain-containing protein, partial [Promethearchaeota archaeon]